MTNLYFFSKTQNGLMIFNDNYSKIIIIAQPYVKVCNYNKELQVPHVCNTVQPFFATNIIKPFELIFHTAQWLVKLCNIF